jgi:hypothetical protein
MLGVGDAAVAGGNAVNNEAAVALVEPLEVQLVDANGKSPAGEVVHAKFADGQTRAVSLDAQGIAQMQDALVGSVGTAQPQREQDDQQG